MNKLFCAAIILCAVFVIHGRDTLKVYNTNTPPVIDGDLSDWNEAYMVRNVAFNSLDQLYYVESSDMSAWTGFDTDYNAKVYLAHDNNNLYIGWQTTIDDIPLHAGYDWYESDNLCLSFGAKDDWMYVINAPILHDSNPRTLAYDYLLDGAEAAVTVQDLPVYEIKLPLLSIPRFYPTNPPFMLISIGTWDADGTGAGQYMGLGATYIGSKHDAITNPWDNSAYYPIMQILSTSPPEQNTAPVISSIVPDSGNRSGSYTASIFGSAFSSGMQVLFGALPSPSVTYYSSTRLDVVVPAAASDGPVNVMAAKDTLRDTLINGFKYYTNYAPVITTVLSQADTMISDSVPYSLDIDAVDPNHDILVYSLAIKPSTMTINSTTGTITWSPTISDSGRQTIRAIVSDNHGMHDTLDFAVHVTPWNYYPIFVSMPETTTLEDSVYRYVLQANDPDADPMSYNIITGPAGMVLSGDTMRWTPVDANIGVHAVSVRASDGKGGSATQTFSLRVINTPDPPLFQSFVPSADTSLAEGDTLKFRAKAVDPDGAEAVGYFWFFNGGYVSNDSTYTLRPDYSDAGVCSVRVVAFDGNGQTVHSWNITVINKSVPPVLIAPTRNGSATGDSTIAWNVSADPDLDISSTMYRVEFATTSGFSPILAMKDSLICASYKMNELVLPGMLPEASVIFVRVAAFDTSGYSTGYGPTTPFIFLYLANTDRDVAMPDRFMLDQNSPNPFNPRTCIRFAVPAMDKGATMHMTVYNIKGSVIRTLVQGAVSPGYHTVAWDSRDDNGAVCQNGVYVLKMACGSFAKCIKMALLK
ncbi:MAG: hypothetical protein A2268_05220 [Candidatus Raymondbacteria bacterium RifOxyA12_full_50_37]|nr:MAG: hypothetical protein A2268_05220 [Candidatus Raymondbacteria bacterium RifOxyA12_full_50_37]OGJ88968.1 MAG: hypothetical protein A2248_02455 [Candidatus Raymondbacteria bacterium RIFOXYA2_FULL_49_16]OGJ96996.1 MAG: hypothetical protein A2453_03875 [Candidatus Raymondbacteria bacterium RIFOXYC2_FULL_50_21]OGK02541.1 MAG: hypothetical protein A2487_14940 [Candidatus Raymondbacteria bacterium RifOxyC12_full_50_8]OGP42066.1 MAG: hypothetical protein A2324_18065 [Candidatus Raymondbacteria b